MYRIVVRLNGRRVVDCTFDTRREVRSFVNDVLRSDWLCKGKIEIRREGVDK